MAYLDMTSCDLKRTVYVMIPCSWIVETLGRYSIAENVNVLNGYIMPKTANLIENIKSVGSAIDYICCRCLYYHYERMQMPNSALEITITIYKYYFINDIEMTFVRGEFFNA